MKCCGPWASWERIVPSRRLAAAVLASLLAWPAFGQTGQKVVPETKPQITMSYAPLVKKAQPAVVNVYASRVDAQPRNSLFDDPIFRHFFGGEDGGGRPGGPSAESLGSGVIVDPSGLVVTNHHVIEGMTDVKVALNDKREFEATIVLRDPRTDLAVLRLKGNTGPLPVLDMADSDAIEVGDLVLALGNPFGVGQTVTQGIVSALARTQVGISDYQFFIQTDAAINPGNSGGALIDMNGRLIGLNTAIFSRSGGSIGIGFAIPSNMVRIVVATAKGGGKEVRRPWLGASLQILSKDIADSLGLDRPSGALVANVVAKGPAAEAGLKSGDVITAVDGQPVEDPDSFGYRLGTKPIGGVAAITALRHGKVVSANVKLSAAPETPPRELVRLRNRSPLSGASAANVSPAVAEELGLALQGEGVVVTDVEADSNAAAIGIQKGDMIIDINGEAIASTKALESATGGRHGSWTVSIGRGGQIYKMVFGG
jgi:Do/DeqQ family serine protease